MLQQVVHSLFHPAAASRSTAAMPYSVQGCREQSDCMANDEQSKEESTPNRGLPPGAADCLHALPQLLLPLAP